MNMTMVVGERLTVRPTSSPAFVDTSYSGWFCCIAIL